MTNKVATQKNITENALQKDVVERTLERIEKMKELGGITLPSDYIPSNAIQAAGLIISELKDKNDQPALSVCSDASIANALLYMGIQGLNPLKNQCYFVVYGKKLVCERSYEGAKLLAKRHSGIIDVIPHVLYGGDIFDYEVDLDSGYTKILKHKPILENKRSDNITGAYCFLKRPDGILDVEIMTFEEIQTSWLMRKGKGLTQAHKDFPAAMSEKTVIKRGCKRYIDSSNDSVLNAESSTELVLDEQKKERVYLVSSEPKVIKSKSHEVEEVKQEQKEEDQPTTDFNDNSDLQGNPGF